MTRLIFRHREREEKQKQVDFETKLQNCKSIDMQALGANVFFCDKKVILFLKKKNNILLEAFPGGAGQSESRSEEKSEGDERHKEEEEGEGEEKV